MISKEEIKKLADLARIDIADGEIDGLRGEMDAILDYVKLVQQFQTDGPSSTGLKDDDLRNVMREDENPTKPETYSADLINEFPRQERNYLKVKKIL